MKKSTKEKWINRLGIFGTLCFIFSFLSYIYEWKNEIEQRIEHLEERK